MAYNPQMYFPQNYQPQYQPFQQPIMPQTRMVEVVPVDTVDAAREFPVAIGATVIMIAKDDSFMAVKINGVNGQSSFEVYDKRPQAPPEPVFDPDAYVTKEELERRLAAFLKPTRGKEKDEPV